MQKYYLLKTSCLIFLGSSFMLLSTFSSKLLAESVIWVRFEISEAYSDIGQTRVNKKIPPNFYTVLEVAKLKQDRLLVKIRVPSESSTDHLGYALVKNLNKPLTRKNLVRVFTKLPKNEDQMTNYIELIESELKETKKLVPLPFIPAMLLKEVIYTKKDFQELWIDDSKNKILYNLNPSRAKMILNTAQNLKLGSNVIQRALEKNIKVRDPYQLVMAIMGEPYVIDVQRNTIFWRYYNVDYGFKNGRVISIKN